MSEDKTPKLDALRALREQRHAEARKIMLEDGIPEFLIRAPETAEQEAARRRRMKNTVGPGRRLKNPKDHAKPTGLGMSPLEMKTAGAKLRGEPRREPMMTIRTNAARPAPGTPASQSDLAAAAAILKHPASEASDVKPAAKAPAKKPAAPKPAKAKKAIKVTKPKKAPAAGKRAAPKGSAKTDGVRPGSKLALIVGLLQRPQGCTTADVLKATEWPAVSMPQQAKAAGLTLLKEKVGKITVYRAKA